MCCRREVGHLPSLRSCARTLSGKAGLGWEMGALTFSLSFCSSVFHIPLSRQFYDIAAATVPHSLERGIAM